MDVAALVLAGLACLGVLYSLVQHPRSVSITRPPRLTATGDPWSTLGPNTSCPGITTGGQTIPPNYIRAEIEFSLDTAVSGGVIYGLLNPGAGAGQNGTASATNFHFVLYANQPPFQTEYTGAIQLVASTGTIRVGIVEH